MKRSTAMSLIVLGAVTFVGLGVLFSKTFPVLISWKSAVLVTALVVGVEAALFLLGIFVGYLYGRSIESRAAAVEMRSRFKEALDFERTERVQLEQRLYQAKQAMIDLRGRLSARESDLSEQEVEAKKAELARMEAEMAEMVSTQSQLHTDLVRRKERIADLLAELSQAQADAEEARSEAERLKASLSSSPKAELSAIDGSSIKEILARIVALEGVKMALVADDCGLVIESVGEGLPTDTVAAISNLVERLGPQVRDILPMGEVSSISLGDEQGLVLDTRYFRLFGVRCALAIARDERYPYPGLAKKVIDSVVESMKE